MAITSSLSTRKEAPHSARHSENRNGLEAAPLPQAEAELIRLIREALPADPGPEYHALKAKGQAGTLTPEECKAFRTLINQREIANARRIRYLVELSDMRQVSLDELMQTLGILKPTYE